MNRLPVQHGAARQRVAVDRQRVDVAHRVRRRPLRRQQAEHVAVGQVHRRDRRVAQAGGALRDRLEHRLHVGRRARDHAQDFADRRLLLERFLRFVEQAHVLDRDRRLVGEGLHQRDLLVGESRRLRAPEDDRADRTVFAHQRDRQDCAEPEPLLMLSRVGVFGVEQRHEIGVIEGHAVDDRATHDQTPIQGQQLALLEYRHGAEAGGKPKLVPLDQEDSRFRCVAQPQRALGDRVEHRAHVGRGTR